MQQSGGMANKTFTELDLLGAALNARQRFVAGLSQKAEQAIESN
jgi:hypothetical protein